jgi:hypothetical protein
LPVVQGGGKDLSPLCNLGADAGIVALTAANQKKTPVGRGAAIAELEERLHVTANAQLAFGPLIVTGGRIAKRNGTLLFGITPASALPAGVDLFNTELTIVESTAFIYCHRGEPF